jgi:AcrR family transcriptional regulator
MPDSSAPTTLRKGQRTRAMILQSAADLASARGLEPLSIGELAAHTGMSKGGLIGHFGSKEELQLATIEHARQIFIDEVVRPALKAQPGLERVNALCERWIDYCRREVFPGGCFFSATTVEYKNRPGPVRDRVVEAMDSWTDTIKQAVKRAQQTGELSRDTDPAQLAFELQAIVMTANWDYQLHRDRGAFKRARAAINSRLRQA